jgi:hypothetical protein
MSVTPVSGQETAADDRPHPEDRLTRDQWGRPEITPPGGGRKIGYRRASSFGAPLESDWNLQLWGKRQVARGIARREDLALEVTRVEIGLDDPDPKKVRAAKSGLDKIAETAMEHMQSSAKASIGTSAHAIYELIDLGRDPGHIPTMLRADVAAYRELTEPRFRMVSIERFVVHDDLRAAGTLDRAAELRAPMVAPDGTVIEAGQVVIGDVKTSQDMSWAGCKFGVQCLIYAEGTPYCTETGRRESWGHAAPRTDWGLIIHVPSCQGTAALYWVNLDEARIAAHHALEVHGWRGRRGKDLITRAALVEVAEDFFGTAAAAVSLDELTSASIRAVASGAWNDVLRQAFTRRKAELIAVRDSDCPESACGARAGDRCVSWATHQPLDVPHRSRLEKARAGATQVAP